MLTRRQKVQKYARKFRLLFRGNVGHAKPLYVVGMQRSGTNMLFFSLARTPVVEWFNENDNEAFDNHVLRRHDGTLDRLISKSRAQLVMFKPICDSQNTSELLSNHPEAKALWAFRHYNDVVNSALRQGWDPTALLQQMASGDPKQGWPAENVSSECVALLHKFLSNPMDASTAWALAWYVRNMLYFDQRLQDSNRVILTQYEALATNPRKFFPAVCSFADIPYNDYLIGKVRSTSIGKNVVPQIRAEVEKLCANLHSKLVDCCHLLTK